MLIWKLVSVMFVISGVPTVGFMLSFFISIVLVGLLFPAWSIAWIFTVYSPSSSMVICLSMSF